MAENIHLRMHIWPTVAFEIFQVHDAGCIFEVDEGLAVSPALYGNAT